MSPKESSPAPPSSGPLGPNGPASTLLSGTPNSELPLSPPPFPAQSESPSPTAPPTHEPPPRKRLTYREFGRLLLEVHSLLPPGRMPQEEPERPLSELLEEPPEEESPG